MPVQISRKVPWASAGLARGGRVAQTNANEARYETALKPKTTVEPAKPYITPATEGPTSKLACRAMPISALAEPRPGSSTTSGRGTPRAGVKKHEGRPPAQAGTDRSAMVSG